MTFPRALRLALNLDNGFVCLYFQIYPDHQKGIMLMGELNVNSLKNLKEAEEVTSPV